MPTIFDAFYVTALAFGSPYFLSKLLINKRFRAGLLQRLGFNQVKNGKHPCIWIHCASVGEVLTAKPLVKSIEKEFNGFEIVLSVNTDTGFSVAEKYFEGKRIFYFPLDLSWVVDKVLNLIRPQFIILIELEIWPNFIIAAAKRHVPVALVNARISGNSAKWYRLFSRMSNTFFKNLLTKENFFCARTQADAARLKELGISESQITITGNMKYDNIVTDISANAKEQLLRLFELEVDERVIVCGSTFEGEEIVLLRVFKDLCAKFNKLRLIIVPRHIERVSDVTKQIESMGFNYAKKSSLDKGEKIASHRDRHNTILVVDTVGELLTIYSIAYCVFVGRSLIPHGGQNVVEPAGLAKPVIVGPHTFNFKEEVGLLKEANAIMIAEDELSLSKTISYLLEHPEESGEIGRRAQLTVTKQMGVVDRNMKILKEHFLKERNV
ncbi:MAG: 3-deoxy-D-manno-octulosonic acid transferase [Candidatus Kuenenia sp.]|nr:3-deoxy-D-manno-octulosonic acid transferase [Candidatus Kuenenia hertensis]